MASIDPVERERNELLAAYSNAFSSADGEKILLNLHRFAQNITDSLVRCGALDLISHVYMMRHRGKDVVAGKVVRGRASLSPTEQSTEE